MCTEPSFNEGISNWNSLSNQRNFSVTSYTCSVHTHYSSVDHSTNFQCVVLYTTLLTLLQFGDEADIYRYAEEYYANAQEEPNYDYDALMFI